MFPLGGLFNSCGPWFSPHLRESAVQLNVWVSLLNHLHHLPPLHSCLRWPLRDPLSFFTTKTLSTILLSHPSAITLSQIFLPISFSSRSSRGAGQPRGNTADTLANVPAPPRSWIEEKLAGQMAERPRRLMWMRGHQGEAGN